MHVNTNFAIAPEFLACKQESEFTRTVVESSPVGWLVSGHFQAQTQRILIEYRSPSNDDELLSTTIPECYNVIVYWGIQGGFRSFYIPQVYNLKLSLPWISVEYQALV